jgi:hypothetical protein
VLNIVGSEKKDSLMSKSFSERHGYRPPDPPITVREDVLPIGRLKAFTHRTAAARLALASLCLWSLLKDQFDVEIVRDATALLEHGLKNSEIC